MKIFNLVKLFGLVIALSSGLLVAFLFIDMSTNEGKVCIDSNRYNENILESIMWCFAGGTYYFILKDYLRFIIDDEKKREE